MTTMQSLIIADEGLKLFPYCDTTGHQTWGIGHNLSAGSLDPSVTVLLNQAVLAQFQIDLDAVLAAASKQYWWAGLDAVRQAAIADMLFNLGTGALETFTSFFDLVARSQWPAAANNLRATKVFTELPVRYARLATMIESGLWPNL